MMRLIRREGEGNTGALTERAGDPSYPWNLYQRPATG